MTRERAEYTICLLKICGAFSANFVGFAVLLHILYPGDSGLLCDRFNFLKFEVAR